MQHCGRSLRSTVNGRLNSKHYLNLTTMKSEKLLLLAILIGFILLHLLALARTILLYIYSTP